MKHVLILCDLFPPAFGPRMGYLCKYLKQSDWTPIVVTEKIPACNFQFLENICEVHTINYYTARHPFLRKLQWLVIFLLSFGFDYKNWKIRRYAEKLISQKQFDALLCSTYRTFPLPAAHKLANKYKLPLIVDLRDIIEQYSVVQLTDIIGKKEFEDMSAILVAAGPSLDKNIEKLKQIKDSVFIMAVDTALNTVLKHDIIPDMTISVDGHKPLVLFEDERVKNIPISLSAVSNAKIVEQSNAMRFYELEQGEYLSTIYNKLGKEIKGLPTGGSVANNACSLLVLMGFKTIIFMGLDLAYPEGVKHTKEAYHELAFIDKGKQEYIEIEDIWGNKVFTEENMNLYRKWFESYIKVMPHIRFIDATEGGALIYGTEIKNMDEVIGEFHNKIYDKNMLWRGLLPYLIRKDQQRAIKFIKEIPQSIERIEKYIDEGLDIYCKIKVLNKKRDNCQVIISKKLKHIGKLNNLMENEMAFNLIRYYAMETSYKVRGEVLNYDRTENMKGQIEGLINNGVMLYEGYKRAVNEFKKDNMNELIESFDIDKKELACI